MAEYINRKDALTAEPCRGISCQDCPLCSDNIFGGCKVANFINSIPAADVAPVRHGRWISDGVGKRFGTVVRLDKDGCPVDTCHCSECGEWLTASDEYPVIGRYCPNCGAAMDKEG